MPGAKLTDTKNRSVGRINKLPELVGHRCHSPIMPLRLRHCIGLA